MSLVSTEQAGFLRDTSNMALINNNKKTYDLYKKQKQIQEEKKQEITNLKNELEELKQLVRSMKSSG